MNVKKTRKKSTMANLETQATLGRRQRTKTDKIKNTIQKIKR